MNLSIQSLRIFDTNINISHTFSTLPHFDGREYSFETINYFEKEKERERKKERKREREI